METKIEKRLKKIAGIGDGALAEHPSREDAQSLWTLVNSVRKDAESVLKAAIQAVPEFTLHDPDHSERVLKNMGSIIPEETLNVLEPLECAILILAAYLHDIGMSPAREEFQKIRKALLTGSLEDLSEGTASELREDLAENWNIVDLPIEERDRWAEEKLADRIVVDWVRAHHDERSAQTIRDQDWDLVYKGTNFQEWLIDVCLSHGRDAEKLRDDRFDTQSVGSKEGRESCNLRYLAMVLRIADICEIDPLRAPPSLYKHQNIQDPVSTVEWGKHFAIRSDSLTNDEITIEARPEQAVFMHALKRMVGDIEHELKACNAIHAAREFKGFFEEDEKKYEWELPSRVASDIKPANNVFVYIDGGFKVDEEQVLHLLAGHNLYGKDPWVALRELLQNAFDAIRLKRALYELSKKGAWKRHPVSNLDDVVRLRLYEQDGRYHLVCEDTGVGMSRKDIERYLLRAVETSSTGKEIADIRRLCQDNDVDFERTSRFGIGALSYFMLADSVKFSTKPLELRQVEQKAWEFEIGGIGDFGELRHGTRDTCGTEVDLCLLESAVSEDGDGDGSQSGLCRLQRKIEEKVSEYFAHIPCDIEIIADEEERATLIDRGWVHAEDDIEEDIVEQFTDLLDDEEAQLPQHLQDRDELDKTKELEARQQDLKDQLIQRLKLHSVEFEEEDGTLLRAVVPWFSYENGNALAFFDPTSESGNPITDLVGDANAWVPAPRIEGSFYGTRIMPEYTATNLPQCCPSINMEFKDRSGISIRVDRFRVEKSSQAHERVSKLVDSYVPKAFQSWSSTVDDGNTYETLNRTLSQNGVQKSSQTVCWPVGYEGDEMWKSLDDWSVISRDISWFASSKDTFRFRNKPVLPLATLRCAIGGAPGPTAFTVPLGVSPVCAAGFLVEDLWIPVPIWAPRQSEPVAMRRLSCELPPVWRDIVSFSNAHTFSFLNRKNWLVRMLMELGDQEYAKTRKKFAGATPREELFQRPLKPVELAFWLVVGSTFRGMRDCYQAAVQNRSEWLFKSWKLLEDSCETAGDRAVFAFVLPEPGARILSPTSIDTVHANPKDPDDEWNHLFPEPPPDWQLSLET